MHVRSSHSILLCILLLLLPFPSKCVFYFLYRCPELNTCIQGFAETCPIEGGVAFSGGSTLSCDDGRCSTDTKCEWSDGSATFGTFYWTNLNGDVTLEDCTGITCTGCVTSDATGTDETEMDMEMDADMSDSDTAEMDAVMNEGDGSDGMTMGDSEAMPEDTTAPGAFTAVSAFVRVSAIALVAGLFLF